MKSTKILLLLLFISCNGQTQLNKELVFALSNESSETRGNIIDLSSTEFRLDYYDVYEKDSHFEFLSSKGYQGGGPSWLGIIYGAIKMSDPGILNKIRFDDESDGIAIWSSDKENLVKISRLIAVLKNNKQVLLDSIEVAEQNWKME